jgi:NADPH:quinone reductase-like Zn-dependent oxidoreductase
VDGVGLTPDGEEVYFSTLDENMGSYAEVVNVLKRNTFPLPRGVDGLQVAALVNPVMSSWMALRKRAVTLPDQFSVLILGATSLSGTLAISVARALGAGKVIGVARNQNKLDNLPLDQTICLQDPATETDFSSLGHVDIILDYVYGSPAAHLLTSLEPSSRLVQYFQIGDLASPHILLPSKAIRSTRLLMCGSGIGSWSFDELRDELPEMVRAVAALPHQNLNVVPLRQIETAWKQVSLDRTVFIP